MFSLGPMTLYTLFTRCAATKSAVTPTTELAVITSASAWTKKLILPLYLETSLMNFSFLRSRILFGSGSPLVALPVLPLGMLNEFVMINNESRSLRVILLYRFIVFNIPGAVFGAWTGKKMGKVRDMKGVSVYEAFAKLGKDRKAEILSHLAQKVFKTAL